MADYGPTEGFLRCRLHRGPELPARHRTLDGRVDSAFLVQQGWLMRLREGECIEWESGPLRPFNAAGDSMVIMPMAMGFGEAEYMPSGEFVLSVNGRDVAEFCVVKYSTLWRQEHARFYFEVKRKRTEPETMVAGVGYLLMPAADDRPVGAPLQMRLYNRKKSYARAHVSPASDRWVRIDACPDLRKKAFLEWGLSAIQEDPKRHTWKGRSLYFGDIHTHCGRNEALYAAGEREFLRRGNCGAGVPMDYYHYARYVSRLDFYSLTDHHRLNNADPQWSGLTEADWAYRLEMVDRWTARDFAPIPGLELCTRYGHWNTYFRQAAPAYPPHESLPMSEIHSTLKERYRAGDVMLVPHQTATICGAPVDWDRYDPALTPIVEMYSHWGSNEYHGNPLYCREVDVDPRSYVSVALERGYRLGFIGSTDEHGGAPGDGVTFINPLGAGVACVWAPELTRESVFDALRDRWCYASTGARMVITFTVDDAAMGREIDGKGPARARLFVDAPEKIKEVVLMKNSREYAFAAARSACGEWEWVDESDSGRETDYYYPRVVLDDGETAWGSPIWRGHEGVGASDTGR